MGFPESTRRRRPPHASAAPRRTDSAFEPHPAASRPLSGRPSLTALPLASMISPMAEQPPGSRTTARRDAGGDENAPGGSPALPPESRSRFRRFLVRSQTQTVVGAAGIVAFGFLASRLLGLLRSVAIADAFGTDPELDAYWVAFRLPDLVFQLLAGATLSAAFIPTFSRVLLRGGEEGAWRLASSVLNL